MSEESNNNHQALFYEYRKEILSRQLSNSERYDAAILTLSMAALGVSVTFLKDVVGSSDPEHLWLLVSSWILFAVSVILTIVSFQISQLGLSRQLEYAEEYLLHDKEEYLSKENKPATWTTRVNITSGITFILAVVLTVLFICINL